MGKAQVSKGFTVETDMYTDMALYYLWVCFFWLTYLFSLFADQAFHSFIDLEGTLQIILCLASAVELDRNLHLYDGSTFALFPRKYFKQWTRS